MIKKILGHYKFVFFYNNKLQIFDLKKDCFDLEPLILERKEFFGSLIAEYLEISNHKRQVHLAYVDYEQNVIYLKKDKSFIEVNFTNKDINDVILANIKDHYDIFQAYNLGFNYLIRKLDK